MRRGELQRALDEFNLAVKHISNDQSRYLHSLQPGAGAGIAARQYDASLADFAEAQKVNPDGPQVPAYRCVTYTEHGQVRRSARRLQRGAGEDAEQRLRADQPRQRLSRQGRSRRGAERLRRRCSRSIRTMSAPMSAAGSCSRNAATLPPPAPTIARRPAPWLARREDIDTTLARAVAKAAAGSLAAARSAPAPAGKASPSASQPSGTRKVALIVGNGAYKNVAAAGQSAARRQADRVDLSRARLCHGDDGARSRAGTNSSPPCTNSASRPKRRIGRWSIMPVTAWKSAA